MKNCTCGPNLKAVGKNMYIEKDQGHVKVKVKYVQMRISALPKGSLCPNMREIYDILNQLWPF